MKNQAIFNRLNKQLKMSSLNIEKFDGHFSIIFHQYQNCWLNYYKLCVGVFFFVVVVQV